MPPSSRGRQGPPPGHHQAQLSHLSLLFPIFSLDVCEISIRIRRRLGDKALQEGVASSTPQQSAAMNKAQRKREEEWERSCQARSSGHSFPCPAWLRGRSCGRSERGERAAVS
ncbi:hypothetical protein EJB05_16258 [Eragrostis curvula]|uniref:Uncharacterized protein n=1 Tax=Eragrostis curvula TaxID=38414 RepID=A0A5J9VEL0_9POAL|nr:hypothetical protein EJB05_16258 [Eragrostis curvula]